MTANNNVKANITHKGDLYYIIVNYYHNGKRKQKWIKTDLTRSGNNKRKIEQKRLEILQEWQDKLKFNGNDILLADYMHQWLEVIKNNVRPTTFYGYKQIVNYAIDPYFRERKITLYELKPYHIQDFYAYKMNNDGISANTILHYHANIHKALAYAVKTERIPTNPADKVELVDEDGTTETLSNVEQSLKNVGIDMRSTITDFDNAGDVLDNLYAKWDSLNGVQQNAIANAFGG